MIICFSLLIKKMYAQIFVLFFCIQFVSSSCPNESFTWQNYCLFFNSTPTSFGNAELSCQRVHGRLASIHDAFYNSVLTQNAQTHFQNSTTNSSDFWIGATKYTWDESWIWDDGTPMNYTDWRKGEPNNSSGNDCAASSWIDGYWSAQMSSSLKPFVCELPKRLFASTTIFPPTVTPSTTTTTQSYPSTYNCSQGWTYYQATGSCYFALKTAQTWTNSEFQCQGLGSELTSIHTDSEFHFLFLKYIKPLKRIFWIGLYSEDSQKSWKWTDTSAFDYSPWLTGYPSNIQGANCGNVIIQQEDVHYDPYFANDQCNQTYFSICKKFYLN